MSAPAIEGTKTEELDQERAINERYVQTMRVAIKNERLRHPLDAVSMPQNSAWTGGLVITPLMKATLSPLFGRVALEPDADNDLGTGFYVSGWHREIGDILVVSWAAPVASLFFDGPGSPDVAAARVVATRTFMHHVFDITDFVDDVYRTTSAPPFVRRSAALNVPTAPQIARPKARPITKPVAHLPRATVRRSAPEPTATPTPPPPPPAAASPQSPAASPTAAKARAVPTPVASEIPKLRAEAAVRTAIAKPRTGKLGSVLSTLQPDQYRLVTWPEDELLVVQGQPGTGKTIVATHRAAYLTNPDREGRSLTKVAIVGPTSQYVAHIQKALTDLDAVGVYVMSLPQLLSRLAGLSHEPAVHTREDRRDTLWEVGKAVDLAVKHVVHRPGDSLQKQISSVIDFLAGRAATSGADNDLVRYLRTVSASKAKSDTRHTPYMAAVGQALRPPTGSELFDHIIIDEAQDVRPLEWRILLRYLKPDGQVSLFGDINQRRCDWTAASWQELFADSELGTDAASLDVQEMTIGYRSTKEILRFANQMLPRADRVVHALSSGPVPRVVSAGSANLVAAGLDAAIELTARHPDGLVAVITMDPRGVSDAFRRKNWTRPREMQHAWEKDGRRVLVLHPINARGLEFDGVVVLEPSVFPENVGRHGTLYTSLTRATRELVVVHAKKLPKDLKPPK